MDNKHTPGPWALANSWDTRRHAGAVVQTTETDYGTKGVPVAYIAKRMGEAPAANAHLIAAAPDLLAALEIIAAYWDAGNFTRRPEICDCARAAIAKARGES